MRVNDKLLQAKRASVQSLSVFVRDVGRGMLEVSHNTLALLGLLALSAAILAGGRAETRHQFEAAALQWLQNRMDARDMASGDVLTGIAEPHAGSRATAANLDSLTREQATLAGWIARRYRVAPEPVAALVQEAWAIGQRAGLDPTLILAIAAVESSFNPFAQSPVGAQGLMQVMTRVHDDKFQAFGGARAAFDPISNLRVGVQVLKDCIARAGSVQEGLRYYVGAALQETDGGYAARVMLEQSLMRHVADGRLLPVNATNLPLPLPLPEPRPLPAAGSRAAEAAPAAPASTPQRASVQVALLR